MAETNNQKDIHDIDEENILEEIYSRLYFIHIGEYYDHISDVVGEQLANVIARFNRCMKCEPRGLGRSWYHCLCTRP